MHNKNLIHSVNNFAALMLPLSQKIFGQYHAQYRNDPPEGCEKLADSINSRRVEIQSLLEA